MTLMFEKDLALPSRLRRKFKEPLGIELYDSDLESFSEETPLITVGDVVSLTFRRRGIRPDLSIYDGSTERREMTEFAQLVQDEPKDEAVNPAGTITAELADAVRRSIEGTGSGLLLVHGEEDLALLPCIILSPPGTRIVYGWPGKCMMLVTTDESIQMKATEMVARMEEIE